MLPGESESGTLLNPDEMDLGTLAWIIHEVDQLQGWTSGIYWVFPVSLKTLGSTG